MPDNTIIRAYPWDTTGDTGDINIDTQPGYAVNPNRRALNAMDFVNPQMSMPQDNYAQQMEQSSALQGNTAGGTPYGQSEYDQRNDEFTDVTGANDMASQDALRKYLFSMPSIGTIDSSLPVQIANANAVATKEKVGMVNNALNNQRRSLDDQNDRQAKLTAKYGEQLRDQNEKIRALAQSGTPLSGMAVFQKMSPAGQVITAVLAGLAGKGGLESMQSTLDNLANNNKEQTKLKSDAILAETHNLNEMYRVEQGSLDSHAKYVDDTYKLALDHANNEFQQATAPVEKLKALLAGQTLRNQMDMQNAQIDAQRKNNTLQMLGMGQALALDPQKGQITGQPVMFKKSKEADEFKAKVPKLDAINNTLKHALDSGDFRMWGEGKGSLLLAQVADATGVKAEDLGGTLTGNAKRDTENLMYYINEQLQNGKRMYTLNGTQMKSYVDQMYKNIPGFKPLPLAKPKVR